MARSDFVWVNFDELFTDNNTAATREFTVQGNPISAGGGNGVKAEGYLLIQARDVEANNHRILINNQELPSFDIPSDANDQWFTWMDRIPEGFLKVGQNRITIRRVANNDNFRVANVAVHWREQG